MPGHTLPTAAALHTLKATAVALQLALRIRWRIRRWRHATGGGVVVDYRCTIDGVPVRSVRKCTKVHRMAVRGKRYAFAMGTGVAAYVSISGGGTQQAVGWPRPQAQKRHRMLMATVTAMATVAVASTLLAAPVTVAVTAGAMVVATRPVAATWFMAAWAAPAASNCDCDKPHQESQSGTTRPLQEKSCRRLIFARAQGVKRQGGRV
jgi:hypothetical protein